MYLKNFSIKNFRSISDLKIEFQKGLNVLVGENNSGKTAIIDALRLSLGIGPNRREIYIDYDDFHISPKGSKADLIEFDLSFAEPSIEEQGVFIELLAIIDKIPELQLHIRYKVETRNGIERIKFNCWGGENEGQPISSDVFDLFYYVHLGALRNAEKDLSPSKGNRTSQLFLKLVEDLQEQNKYAKDIQDKIDELENWKELKKRAKEKVNAHLNNLTFENAKQEIDINHMPVEYKKIVENLKMHLLQRFEDDSILPFEIYQNGLGYNNLIYISTVLGDVFERKSREKESFISLFIEEPEAHLHPQLQDILFNFLKKTTEKNIQIFITSHSPTV
jgi:putative ATP-dependent endonuclease of OLD family